MMQNNLASLSAKIRKACPELMELSFGCKFKAKAMMAEFLEGFYQGIVVSDDVSYVDCKGGHREIKTKMIHFEKEKFEILGHPIRLEHVLRAIGPSQDRIRITSDGRILAFNTVIGGFILYGFWDLKSDLSGQTLETVEWLDSVIN